MRFVYATRPLPKLEFATASQRDPRLDKPRHAVECRRPFPPAQVVRRSNDVGPTGPARAFFPHGDETMRILVGQFLDQRGVDDGENRGVRADAERQRDDGHGGEAGRAQTQTNGVFDVLEKSVHEVFRSRSPPLWLMRRPAESPTT